MIPSSVRRSIVARVFSPTSLATGMPRSVTTISSPRWARAIQSLRCARSSVTPTSIPQVYSSMVHHLYTSVRDRDAVLCSSRCRTRCRSGAALWTIGRHGAFTGRLGWAVRPASAAMMRKPSRRSQSRAASRPMSTTGSTKTAPVLAFTTSGCVGRTWPPVNSTPDAPAPSAQRTTMPRLPGSWRPSATTTRVTSPTGMSVSRAAAPIAARGQGIDRWRAVSRQLLPFRPTPAANTTRTGDGAAAERPRTHRGAAPGCAPRCSASACAVIRLIPPNAPTKTAAGFDRPVKPTTLRPRQHAVLARLAD